MAQKPTILLAILLALVAFASSSALMEGINERRVEEGLTYGDVSGSLGPYEAIVTSLGSFRGWFINYLWLRANRLEVEGKYHEAQDLAWLIAQLLPHFENVWDFLSWNLHTNASLAAPTPEERWLWIENGISLLRDGAIVENPFSRRLHDKIAYAYQGRVGSKLDRTHWYYKERLARQWERILGPPPGEKVDSTRRKMELLAWFAPVSEAPIGADMDEELDVILANDRVLALRIEELRDQGQRIDLVFLNGLIDRAIDPTRSGTLFEQWLLHTASPEQRDAMLGYARSRIIRDEFKMDPRLMRSLMGHFPNLDWRHYATHALYWAAQGELRSRHRRIKVSFVSEPPPPGPVYDRYMADLTAIFANQQVRFALKFLMQSGIVVHDSEGDFFRLLPDPRFVPFYVTAFNTSFQTSVGGPAPTLLNQFHGSLVGCLELSLLYHGDHAAEAFYDHLQGQFPERGPYPERVDEYLVADIVSRVQSEELYESEKRGLSEREIIDKTAELRDEVATNEVHQRLRQAFDYGVASGNNVLAERVEDFVIVLHGKLIGEGRRLPLDFHDVRIDAIREYLLAPAAIANPYQKKRLWAQLPPSFAKQVYDDVEKEVRAQMLRVGLDPDEHFKRKE